LEELHQFSDELAEKPMFVVASKIDACQDPSRVETLKAKALERGLPFFAISSVTGQGLDELRFAVGERVFASVEQTAP
jgi:GTPase